MTKILTLIEPEPLKRGKEFHRLVQKDWLNTAEGNINTEHTIRLFDANKQISLNKKGRLDLFVDEMEDFVSVVEIKGADWDQIKPANIQKNLYRHRRQIWNYISKYHDGDKLDVAPGIIYPSEPKTEGLKERVENYLNDWGIQVVWHFD